jgi:hypothetical protein
VTTQSNTAALCIVGGHGFLDLMPLCFRPGRLFVAPRNETVRAGLQGIDTTTLPLPTIGDAPLRLRSGLALSAVEGAGLGDSKAALADSACDGHIHVRRAGRALTTPTSAQWQYVMRVGREAEGLRCISPHVIRAGADRRRFPFDPFDKLRVQHSVWRWLKERSPSAWPGRASRSGTRTP